MSPHLNEIILFTMKNEEVLKNFVQTSSYPTKSKKIYKLILNYIQFKNFENFKLMQKDSD